MTDISSVSLEDRILFSDRSQLSGDRLVVIKPLYQIESNDFVNPYNAEASFIQSTSKSCHYGIHWIAPRWVPICQGFCHFF